MLRLLRRKSSVMESLAARCGRAADHGHTMPPPANPHQPRLSFTEPGAVSPITTHMLDTACGRPAAGVRVVLEKAAPGSNGAWQHVGGGRTNKDGRIPDLLPPSNTVEAGLYRISFDTAEYMERCRAAHPDFFPARPFYPRASVVFEIQPHQVRGEGTLGEGRCFPMRLRSCVDRDWYECHFGGRLLRFNPHLVRIWHW